MNRFFTLVCLCSVAVLLSHPQQRAIAAQRCFKETNQCMDGRIAEFWEQNGGLSVFGFPIGPQEQTTVDGKTFTVQRFERNRLELHPENARPYDVLLGRLGADRLGQQGRDWFGFPKSGDTGGCKVFAETGHAVCGAILKAWRSNGLQIDGKKAVSDAESLALFGMPLSGLITETLSDGKQYQVQWFERARFELHPENAAPYDVLLGLLGNEVGIPVGTRPLADVQPTAVRVGPGAKYIPFPSVALTFPVLSTLGYSSEGIKTTWEITQPYAQGLDDGTATIVDPSTKRTGLVQFFLRSESFRSPQGSHWAVNYGLAEYASAHDAEALYASTDITYPGSNALETYALEYNCKMKSVSGHNVNGVIVWNDLYLCGSKVLYFSILGQQSQTAMQDQKNTDSLNMIYYVNPKSWFLVDVSHAYES
jgi:hypothetical protein